MKKFQFIWDEIFHMNIYWFRGPRKEYVKLVMKMFNREAPRKPGHTAGTFEVYFIGCNPVGVIWLRTRKISTMAHECFHATHWILDRSGVALSDDSEEVYAYHQEFLINKMRKGA